jgi:hypothetical protein
MSYKNNFDDDNCYDDGDFNGDDEGLKIMLNYN